jgi:hypothetical protein
VNSRRSAVGIFVSLLVAGCGTDTAPEGAIDASTETEDAVASDPVPAGYMGYARVTADPSLLLRKGRGTAYSSVGSLPIGTIVYVKDVYSGWAAVQDRTGYAKTSYLQRMPTFALKGLHSGLCLDVWGARRDAGTPVALYPCHDGWNQQFTRDSSSRIVVYGDMCLDAAGGDGRNGDQLIIFPCHGGANQRWRILPSGEIKGMNNRCLDVDGRISAAGSKVQLWDCNDQSHQRWLYRGYRDDKPVTYASGCYGAIGAMCGDSVKIANIIKIPAAFCWSKGDGLVECYASVGAILHDTCCLQNSSGFMCDFDDRSETCKAEWHHAVNDFATNCFWRVTYTEQWEYPVSLSVVSGNGPSRDSLRAPSDTVIQAQDGAAGWCENGVYAYYGDSQLGMVALCR